MAYIVPLVFNFELMPNEVLPELTAAVNRLDSALESGEVPEELLQPISLLIETAKARIAIVQATTGIAEEEVLTKLFSVRAKSALEAAHIDTIDQLLLLDSAKLVEKLRLAGLGHIRILVKRIIEGLNENGIPHKFVEIPPATKKG